LKSLRTFTGKHRPTISEVGVRALGVLGDPTRAEREPLRPRLDSQRVETVFWVTAASVVPLSYFPTADEMRGQLTLAADANRRSGMAGALFVVLVDTGSGITNVVPVGFPEGP
ncbi:hypothetical protein B0H14DRAFT_2163120, partial [Mycena olivaceomarginata]